VDVALVGPTPVAKDNFDINEIQVMGRGDIMLQYTAGLTEHHGGDRDQSCRDARPEQVLREATN
jgi:hypothetical protein